MGNFPRISKNEVCLRGLITLGVYNARTFKMFSAAGSLLGGAYA